MIIVAMTNLTKLPSWADDDNIFAVVETPRGSSCKLDFDPKPDVFALAKPLMAGLTYPYDWGFIPSTKAEDGDALDVLILHDAQTFRASCCAVAPSAFSKSNKEAKARRSETTVCLLCLTGHRSKRILRISAICPPVRATISNSSFERRMHWKIRN